MKKSIFNCNARRFHDDLFVGALILLLGFSPLAQAANYTWDTVSGDGATITVASGTWDTTTANWNTGSANAAWLAANTAVFGGSDGAYTITVGAAIPGVDGITFNNSGYTLSASSARTLASSAATAQTITLASGKTAAIGNNVTLGNTGTQPTTITGSGNLTIGGSGVVISAANNLLNVQGGATLTVNSGGSASGTQVVIGNANGSGTLNVAGGSVSASSSTANIVLANNASGSVSGTLTISGGTLSNPNITTGGLRFGSASAGTGTSTASVNLNGGTIQVGKVFEGAGSGNTQTSTFNFNGGTLKVQTAATLAANFMTGLDNAFVNEGGAFIDPNGVATTIGQSLQHGGVAATDGGLTVNDTAVTKGTLTLTGANSYTGPTTITAGTLALDGSGTLGTNTITVASGATLDVSSATLATALTLGASQSLKASATGGNTTATIKGLGTKILTVGAGGIAFTNYGGGATAPLTASGVVGAITLSSAPITINTTAALTGSLGGTAYTLIDTASSGTVSGSLASSTPTITGSGLASGCTATVSITGGKLILTVTSSLATTTTTIARHSGTGASSTYGDALQFDVTVTGSSPTGTVTVKDGGASGTTLGSAALSGGSATITVSPPTSLSAGTHNNIVAVYGGDSNNNGSTSSALSPSQVVSQKSLTVSSAAALDKLFDGTTSATITGTLSGVLVADAGNVALVGNGSFPSSAVGGPYTVTASCTLSGSAAANYTVNPQPSGLTASILNGGVWTNKVSGNWGTAANWTNTIIAVGTNVTADFSQVDITSDVTVNLEAGKTIGNLIFGNTDVSPNANWTVSGANILTLAGTTPTVTVNALGTGKTATISSVVAGASGLTKTGNGTLTLSGANTYTGSTVVNAGTLQVSGGNAISDSGVVNLANASGATLQVINTEKIANLSGGGATGGTVTIDANQALILSAGTNAFNGALSGSGNITNAGAVQTLGGTSTGYSGTITISSGGVVVNADGALGNASSGTVISDGGALALSNNVNYATAEPIIGSGRGTLTANTGPFVAVQRGMVQSVSGNNTFAGNVEINASGTTRFGVQDGAQLTLGGNITLAAGVANVTVLFRVGASNGDFITLTSSNNSWDNDTLIFSGNTGTGAGVRLAIDNALPTTVGIVAGGGSTGNGTALDLAGYNQTFNGLPNSNGRLNIGNSSSTLSTLTLDVATANKSTFTSGAPLTTIIDGTGSGKVAVVKTGNFAQELFGSHTYSGNTTVSNGTLSVTGSISNSVATVGPSGILNGTGYVGGATINGTIQGGVSSIGTLTLLSAPTLSGTVKARINSTNAQSADKIALTTGTLTYAGNLVLTNIGPALASGNTFTLFNAPAYGGSFSSISPGGTPHWQTANLTVDGTITFTNTAPVAQNISIGVGHGESATLLIVGGKYAPTDVEGDALTVTNVSTPSSGTASFSGNSINYSATGSVGTNTFTYTVADSFGATDTKTVTVIVSSPQGFNQVSAEAVSGNAVLGYLGVPGSNYALDITHGLPATNWIPVITNTASPSGSLSFTNPISLSPTNDYYRTRYVP